MLLNWQKICYTLPETFFWKKVPKTTLQPSGFFVFKKRLNIIFFQWNMLISHWVMLFFQWIMLIFQLQKLLHFEWSPPWHHIETYLSQILTFFVLKSGEDEKETIILMKSRALRSLDFIRLILSSSSLLLVRDPAVTTVIYLAKLIQTDSRYAWFKRISDARASRDA